MSSRGPGRRACARLPEASARAAVLGLLGATFVAGCTSNAASTRDSTTPTSTAAGPNTTAPTTTAPPSPGPVGLPVQPSPTPIKRTLRRPAGAKVVDFGTCIAPTNVVGLYLKQQILEAPQRSIQEMQLADLPTLLNSEFRNVRKAHATWLADGYPAGFPVVKDIDGFIAVYSKLQNAVRTKDLEAVPTLYLRLTKVIAQYDADAGAPVCAQ
jgi:hypothetical protein